MINIRVEYVLDMNVEDVFDAITDHENYERYPGFDSSELLETGRIERNWRGRAEATRRRWCHLQGTHHLLRKTVEDELSL